MEGGLRQPDALRIKDNPNLGEDWRNWREEFESFLDALEVPEEKHKRRIAYLLTV